MLIEFILKGIRAPIIKVERRRPVTRVTKLTLSRPQLQNKGAWKITPWGFFSCTNFNVRAEIQLGWKQESASQVVTIILSGLKVSLSSLSRYLEEKLIFYYVQAFYSDWLYQKFFEKVSNITNHCSRPVVIQPISVECLHIGSMQAFYTDWLYLAMDFLSQYNQSLQNAFTYLVHKHSTVIGYIRISQIEYFYAELPDI